MDAITTTSSPRLPAPTKQHPRSTRHSTRLGIKKRKPRSSAVITAANHLARAAAAASPLPRAPPVAVSPPPPPFVSPPVHPASLLIPSAPAQTFTPDDDLSPPTVPESKSKRKGLRHFAIRVSRKVEEKRVTTYNEVADELVAEERFNRHRELIAAGDRLLNGQVVTVDEKNIRRRVYDSLNVLMAMRIIAKDKKLISWQGLAMAQSTQTDEDVNQMRTAIQEKRRALEEKRKILMEIKEQDRKQSFIVERNRMNDTIPGMEYDCLSLPQSMMPLHQQYPDRIGIPYILVSAPKDTNIELEMDENQEDICFTFNSAFAIFDDREILRRMDIPYDPSPSDNSICELERLRSHMMMDSTTTSGTL